MGDPATVAVGAINTGVIAKGIKDVANKSQECHVFVRDIDVSLRRDISFRVEDSLKESTPKFFTLVKNAVELPIFFEWHKDIVPLSGCDADNMSDNSALRHSYPGICL